MCGRYTLTTEQEALAVALGVPGLLRLHPRPRFNIAPTQEAPVLLGGVGLQGGAGREGTMPGGTGQPGAGQPGAGEPGNGHPEDGGRAPGEGEAPTWTARSMRWGLVPGWAPDPGVGSRLINARAETVASKPSFREAFRHRRCLVPADGFFEWSTGTWTAPVHPGGEGEGPGGGARAPRPKTPWFIHLPERRPFTLAGLWERWFPPGGAAPLETFTLLTTDAVGGIQGLHPRMPVLVPASLREAWVGEAEEAAPHLLERILEATRSEGASLVAHPVGSRVGSPAHDDPGLLEPADLPPPTPAQGSLFD